MAGESLYSLSKRHDISRKLVRVWVQKFEAGALDEDAQAADRLQEYEAKIVALERMVGRQALEIEFLKGALKNAPRPRSANTSVIAGPAASRSQDADGMGRSTFYDTPEGRARDQIIVAEMKTICEEFEAYGYRRVDAELRHRGIVVNAKRSAC